MNGSGFSLWTLKVLLYRLFQLLGAAVGTAPNLLFGNRGEPPFDLVDPGCTRITASASSRHGTMGLRPSLLPAARSRSGVYGLYGRTNGGRYDGITLC